MFEARSLSFPASMIEVAVLVRWRDPRCPLIGPCAPCNVSQQG